VSPVRRSQRLPGRLLSLLAAAWRALRVWSGDAAYEIYAARAGGAPPLSREDFYLDALQRRYRNPSRCC
jgi:hypothetical protein